MNNKKEKVVCPECGHNFEIQEYPPVWSFGTEGKEVQRAINSSNLLRKINSTVFGVLGFILLLFFILIDINNIVGTSFVGWVIWIINGAIRIFGIFYIYKLENKLFKKLMIKWYPSAFNL